MKERHKIVLVSRAVVLMCAVVLAMTGCTESNRSEEATALNNELLKVARVDLDKALERVDSAEEAGVFAATWANTVRASIYENAGLRQMAAYYAERAIAAEAGQSVTTTADSNNYCLARWILADGAYINGEYGKSLTLAKEVLSFVGDGTTPRDIEMRCRALTQMAECESGLHHIAESERLYQQSIDILMESTRRTARLRDVNPLIFALLSLNDLYFDNKMPERSLPLMAKMDTAMNRLMRCADKTDWTLQMRKNNVTISKAIAYVANNQKAKAEILFQEHRQSEGLDDADITAEGAYLTMMCIRFL